MRDSPSLCEILLLSSPCRAPGLKDQLFGSKTAWVGWGSSTRRGGSRKACSPKFREWRTLSLAFPGSLLDVPDAWGCSSSLCTKSLCPFQRMPKRATRRGGNTHAENPPPPTGKQFPTPLHLGSFGLLQAISLIISSLRESAK